MIVESPVGHSLRGRKLCRIPHGQVARNAVLAEMNIERACRGFHQFSTDPTRVFEYRVRAAVTGMRGYCRCHGRGRAAGMDADPFGLGLKSGTLGPIDMVLRAMDRMRTGGA